MGEDYGRQPVSLGFAAAEEDELAEKAIVAVEEARKPTAVHTFFQNFPKYEFGAPRAKGT